MVFCWDKQRITKGHFQSCLVLYFPVLKNPPTLLHFDGDLDAVQVYFYAVMYNL